MVQHSETHWAGVVPTSTEVQQISKEVTKYTVVMEEETTKKQVVVLYNTVTKTPTIVTTDVIKPQVEPYYVTETVTEGGVIVESNSVTEIETTHK